MRHLLEVGWDVWVVTREVRVVKLDVNNVLDVAFGRIELAATRYCMSGSEGWVRNRRSCKPQ